MEYLLEVIATEYDLDEFVANRLELSYETFMNGTKKKRKVLANEQIIGEMGIIQLQNGTQRELTLQDLQFL